MKTNLKRPKKNTRKAPCEVCGAKTGSQHSKKCHWAYIARPTEKARGKGFKITAREKLQTIKQIIKL